MRPIFSRQSIACFLIAAVGLSIVSLLLVRIFHAPITLKPVDVHVAPRHIESSAIGQEYIRLVSAIEWNRHEWAEFHAASGNPEYKTVRDQMLSRLSRESYNNIAGLNEREFDSWPMSDTDFVLLIEDRPDIWFASGLAESIRKLYSIFSSMAIQAAEQSDPCDELDRRVADSMAFARRSCFGLGLFQYSRRIAFEQQVMAGCANMRLCNSSKWSSIGSQMKMRDILPAFASAIDTELEYLEYYLNKHDPELVFPLVAAMRGNIKSPVDWDSDIARTRQALSELRSAIVAGKGVGELINIKIDRTYPLANEYLGALRAIQRQLVKLIDHQEALSLAIRLVIYSHEYSTLPGDLSGIHLNAPVISLRDGSAPKYSRIGASQFSIQLGDAIIKVVIITDEIVAD